jgi:hypothetical protein
MLDEYQETLVDIISIQTTGVAGIPFGRINAGKLVIRGSIFDIKDYEDLGGVNLDTLSHYDVISTRLYALPLVSGPLLASMSIAVLVLRPLESTHSEYPSSSAEGRLVFERIGLLLIDEGIDRQNSDSLWRWGLTPDWRMETKQEIVIA